MGLNRLEQAEALAHLLKEDYDAYTRLIEDAPCISREQKIELLGKALALTAQRVRPAIG